jgi:hypothetical protein
MIKQLEGIRKEFRYIAANMVILKNYFEQLIESYKEGNYSDPK